MPLRCQFLDVQGARAGTADHAKQWGSLDRLLDLTDNDFRDPLFGWSKRRVPGGRPLRELLRAVCRRPADSHGRNEEQAASDDISTTSRPEARANPRAALAPEPPRMEPQ